MQKLEIEYKFSIFPNQLEGLKTLLQEQASTSWHYYKEDIYYRKIQADNTFLDIRIRNTTLDNDPSTKQIVLTYKNRVDTEGKIYKEHETQIEDEDVIATLIKHLGCEQYVFKNKMGWAYTLDIPIEHELYTQNLATYILAELSSIDSLGYFLELEILANINSEEEDIELIKDYILHYSSNILHIDQNQLELRPYIEMIRALNYN